MSGVKERSPPRGRVAYAKLHAPTSPTMTLADPSPPKRKVVTTTFRVCACAYANDPAAQRPAHRGLVERLECPDSESVCRCHTRKLADGHSSSRAASLTSWNPALLST